MSRLLAAPLFLPLTALDAAPPEGVAGPLVGAVGPDRAALWMYVPTGSKCAYTFHPDGDSAKPVAGAFAAVPDPAAEGPGRPHKAVVQGLSPNTKYRYTVTVDGKTDPVWTGSFKTAPAAGQPAAFRLALVD